MKMWKRWCLSILAWLLISSPTFAQVTQIIGAAVDPTVPPTQPCTTFGFVEETQLTLPSGFNQGAMIRVIPNRTTGIPYNNIGYAITDDSVTQRIVVFDLTSMTVRASATIQTCAGGQYRCLGARAQGDEDPDGRLYLFQEANQNVGSCAAGSANCISFQRWIENATKQTEAFTAPCITSNLDDARDDGAGAYLLITNRDPICGGTGRELRLFSKSTLSFASLGSAFSPSAFGHLSRTFNGNLYAIVASATAVGFRVPAGSATQNGTFTVSASFGARLPAAIYRLTGDQATPVQQIATESDQTGGAQAFRAYNNESDLVNCCTGSYAAGGTDGTAIFQATFYDSINNKVFSARQDGANEELIRTTPGPNTFTVEATLNCVNCNWNTGASTGGQQVDYAPHKMRLFTISSTSPAVINRIRVCATGGPPA